MADREETIREEILNVAQNAMANISNLLRLVEQPGSCSSSGSSTSRSSSTALSQATGQQSLPTSTTTVNRSTNPNHNALTELRRRFPTLGGGRNDLTQGNRSRRTTAARPRPYSTVGRPPASSLVPKDVLIVDVDIEKQPTKSEKAALESKGRLISGFDIDRNWTSRQLKDQLATLLTGEMEGLLFEIVKASCGNLLVPNLPAGKQIDSKLLLKSVCPSGILYIRLLEELSSNSEDESLYSSQFDVNGNANPVLERRSESPSLETAAPTAAAMLESPMPADPPSPSPAESPALPLEVDIEEVIPQIISHCRNTDIGNNPVELLRYMQKKLVRGRALDVRNAVEMEEGATSLIMIDREQLLTTAFDEVSLIPNKFLTLEVQFYSELAEDFGGPRKEFFSLIMKAIKERYFDDGLLEHHADQYQTIGVIMGLSMLQNGTLPRFLSENHIEEVFVNPEPPACFKELRKGLQTFGIITIAEEFPILTHLLRPSDAQLLTLKRMTLLLKAEFSEEGSNSRRFEGQVYSKFIKYMREAASGRRLDGNVTLSHILRFVTGAEDEPLLGFYLGPSLVFVEVQESFLPTASTCINSLKLPRATVHKALPEEALLFNMYDHAFANSYFGMK